MKIGTQLKFGSAVLILLLGVSLSCTRSLSVPVSPTIVQNSQASSTPTNTTTGTATATMVNTATNTATSTPTGTPVNTATVTPSATPTSTNLGGNTSTATPSATVTDTPTVTPTATFTNSPTATTTATASATPTATSAGCFAAYQSSYTFPSDTMCWSAWGSIGGTYVSPTLTEAGGLAPPTGNAITTFLNFTAGTAASWPAPNYDPEYVIVGMQFATPVPTIPANTVIDFYYQCPSNATSISGQAILNATTGSATGGSLGAWVNTLNTTWSQCAMTLTSPAYGVSQIGMQFLFGGSASNVGLTGPVSVDIAAVSIFTLSGCVAQFTYADDTADGWAQVYPTAASLGTTNVSAFPPTGASNTYALLIPWVGSTTLNDIQSEVDGGSTITPVANWSAMNITAVKFQYWVDPAFGSYNYTLAPYVISNGNHYGGTYEGWTDQCSGTCSYVGSGTWLTSSLTPSGGTWTTDQTAVTAVGVDINISASVQDTSGNFIVDNVCLY